MNTSFGHLTRAVIAVLLLACAMSASANQTVASAVGGWACSPDVCRLANGDLMCVFQGSVDAEQTQFAFFAIRSSDDGNSWTQPEVVLDTEHVEAEASITQLRDGRVVIAYWAADLPDVYLVWSNDGAHTWTTPYRQSLPRMPAPWDRALYVSDPVRELDDGTLVVAVYGLRNDTSYYFNAGVSRSTDGGHTWSTIAVPNPENQWWPEPGIAQALDGSLWMFIRPGAYFSRSGNRGRSWSTPVPPPQRNNPRCWQGQCSYLLFTSAGAGILAVRRGKCWIYPYEDTADQGPQAINTMDNGQTWTEWEAIDLAVAWGAHCSLVELPGDRVLCLYYADHYENGKGYGVIRQQLLHAGYGGIHLIGQDEYPHEFSPGWQMAGVPSDVDLPEAEAALSGLSTYQYNPGPARYIARRGVFTKGRGFWCRATTPVFANTHPPLDRKAARVPLAKGWNIISPPLAAAVPWDASHVSPDPGVTLEPYAFTWNTRTEDYDLIGSAGTPGASGSQLLPWRAYWVYCATGGGVRFAAGTTQSIAAPKRYSSPLLNEMAGRVDWFARFTLAANGRKCAQTGIGVGDHNQKVLGPPAPPDCPGMVGSAEDDTPLKLLDVRTSGAQTWDIVATTTQAGSYRLGWQLTKQSVEPLGLTVTSLDNGQVLDADHVYGLSWNARAGDVRHFRVAVQSGQTLAIADAAARFTNDRIALQCSVTMPAWITVTLLNVAGTTVSPATEQFLDKGLHQILLNATGPTGCRLPAGTYLCQVSARDAKGRKASRLCTLSISSR